MACTTLVIFGASGDLTQRKLGPALFDLYCKGRLSGCSQIVGFARRPYNDETFQKRIREGIERHSKRTFDEARWREFAPMLHYFRGHLDQPEDFVKLENDLSKLGSPSDNRIYYLATAPSFYETTVAYLGAAGAAQEKTEGKGFRHLIVEKPFGHNLISARTLNQSIHKVFQEDQIYRIDHYLGKETAQNILFFRFANTIFEPIWNRRYIDHVQITVAESVDIENRGRYYDESGVWRDMFQNHLFQLLTLVAMEPSASFNANALRNEKVKVLRAVRPIAMGDTLGACYQGYRETEGVAERSMTSTYGAMKLYIDNWRWKGVPFYLRSGKALRQKVSQIIVEFQRPPHVMFEFPETHELTPNILSLRIQPDEGVHLTFEAKVPDSMQETRSVDMDFHYRSSFADKELPTAYATLLQDALESDASLFTRSDEIETAWKLIDPVIEAWQKPEIPLRPPLATYDRGSWGPDVADTFMKRDGRQWRIGEIHHGEN